MAAGEDQPQLVVPDGGLVHRLGRLFGRGLDVTGKLGRHGVEARPRRIRSMALNRPADTSQAADCGQAVARPLLGGGREGIVQRLLCRLEPAEQPDQGCEHAARLGAIDRLDVGDAVTPIGIVHARTSMVPCRATGDFAAMAIASRRSRARITMTPPTCSLVST